VLLAGATGGAPYSATHGRRTRPARMDWCCAPRCSPGSAGPPPGRDDLARRSLG